MESLVNLASKLSINSRQPNQASSALPWWKEAVCYQVWPNSFKDSTGNGHGDIRGVIEKLDYIKDLGIDCIWLSPTYKSPMKDQGYDISDYEDINPNFGNMQDMKDLIAGVHKRGMKIILDLVINHTSDQHAWFKESRSSTDNAKKDWYIWRPPRYDKNGERLPPTNWRAALVGGSAWEWCEERQQYYLHLFLPSQPDVNFECEEARQAIFQSAIVSWLKLGVDGFRIDTVNRYSKRDFDDAEGHDNDSYFQDAEKHVMNGPRLHPYIQEMRREMDKHAKGELLLVGELPDCTKDEVLDFVLASRHEISMVFDFDMVKMGGNDAPDYWDKHQVRNMVDRFDKERHDGMGSFDLPEFKSTLMKVQALMTETNGEAWGSVFAENHDQPRSLRRFATDDPNMWPKNAKLLAMLWATLSGTLFLYQGQEIGMRNIPGHWQEDKFRDVDATKFIENHMAKLQYDGWKTTEYQRYVDQIKWHYDRDVSMADAERHLQLKYPHDQDWEDVVIGGLHNVGRDNSRTPMQWNASQNAGFTQPDAEPWIGVNDNKKELNVAAQIADDDSALHFWEKMIRVRKQHKDVFIHGVFECLAYLDKHTFEYTKKSPSGKVAFVALNFSDERQPVGDLQAIFGAQVPTLLAWNANSIPTDLQSPLEAWEGRVYLGESVQQSVQGATDGHIDDGLRDMPVTLM